MERHLSTNARLAKVFIIRKKREKQLMRWFINTIRFSLFTQYELKKYHTKCTKSNLRQTIFFALIDVYFWLEQLILLVKKPFSVQIVYVAPLLCIVKINVLEVVRILYIFTDCVCACVCSRSRLLFCLLGEFLFSFRMHTWRNLPQYTLMCDKQSN